MSPGAAGRLAPGRAPGGEGIGAVLVQGDRPLEATEKDRVVGSVSRSAPVLVNLRTLALAEARAATDALTGLPNARSCQDTLRRMIAHAGRTVSPLSAILLDLDHFKQINDRFGHGAGDDVLAAVSAVIASTIRASDFAGRAGGEEFLLLLPDTDQEGAMEMAEKVRAAVAEVEVPRVEREITASLGVATYPRDAREGDTLLRQADRALYAAKAAGRNRVELSSTTPPSDDGTVTEEGFAALLRPRGGLRQDRAAALEGTEPRGPQTGPDPRRSPARTSASVRQHPRSAPTADGQRWVPALARHSLRASPVERAPW
jgi:diguanylate cyclase (GGDEF)-like protein